MIDGKEVMGHLQHKEKILVKLIGEVMVFWLSDVIFFYLWEMISGEVWFSSFCSIRRAYNSCPGCTPFSSNKRFAYKLKITKKLLSRMRTIKSIRTC